MLKIVKYSWSLKRYYLATGFFVIVISLMRQAAPFFIKFIVDGLVAVNNGEQISSGLFVFWVSMIAVIGLAETFIDNYNGYLGDILAAKLKSLLAQRYYGHILSLPMSYFDNEITGRITSRLDRSIDTISQLINAFTNNFLAFFLSAGITIGILAYYSWPVAVLLASLFPLYMWLTTLSSRSWQQKQEGINRDTDFGQGRFVEAVSQIRVVKSFVQEAAESRIFADSRKSIEGRTRGQSVQWHKYDIVRRIGLNLVFAAIYAFIVYRAFRGDISLGTMVLMVQLVTQAQFPLFASSFIIDQIQRAAAGSKDYFGVMDLKPSIKDVPGAKTLKVKRAAIDYENIDFAYEGGKQVLHDVSFRVEPGQKVALVGESGEGKTTVSNLLLRFYEPSSGRILIDRQDIGEVTQASLRSRLGVVFQEPALFSGSVKENICYGQKAVKQADLTRAAKAANAHDFIEKLPKGYDTEIGERGVKLSGGQKQRIAIARAILKNPPILILDEATSSLDSKAEREVQDALERLMEGRTTMIIAHRLSTIANVDLIVGIKGGKVAEIGSPEELADLEGGIYAELLQLQTAPLKQRKALLKQYELAG